MAENEPATAKRGKSSEIIQKFNSFNAKILAILLVCCLLGYHGVLKFINDIDSCHELLTKGKYQGNNLWKPYGCMMHSFSRIDADNCLRKTRFITGEDSYWVFVGDSRIVSCILKYRKLNTLFFQRTAMGKI